MTYTFLPIAIETLGSVNDSAYEFLKMLGRKITEVSRAVSFLFQRLTVIIQRFNVALFCGTFILNYDLDL